MSKNIGLPIKEVNRISDAEIYKNPDMSIGERVREARKEAKLSQKDLAAKVGISQPTLSELERGDSRGTTSIATMAAALGVNALWLETGRGPKRSMFGPAPSGLPPPVASDAVADEYNVRPIKTELDAVPLISWVQAGNWCEAQDPYPAGDGNEWLSCPVRHGPRTYALQIRGESMRNPGGKPSFDDGDIVFVDPERSAVHKSLVIAKLDLTNEVTFKRLLIDGSDWYLEALNPAWPNRIIPIQAESHICGVVIAKLEKFV